MVISATPTLLGLHVNCLQANKEQCKALLSPKTVTLEFHTTTVYVQTFEGHWLLGFPRNFHPQKYDNQG